MNLVSLKDGNWIINLDQVQSVHFSPDRKSAKVYFDGGYTMVEDAADVETLYRELQRELPANRVFE